MKLIDRYLLTEWLKVFGMALGVMIGLVLIGETFNSMPDFLQWKTPPGTMAWYYLNQIPAIMPIVLPVTTLISMLFVLGHLHKNQELTAMRAAGLSVWRITRMLWVGGAASALLLLVFNAVVIPMSIETARTIKETSEFRYRRATLGDAALAEKNTSVLFDNGRDQRRWRIDSLGAYTGQAANIRVYELDEKNAMVRQVFAEFGRYDPERGLWTLENGREVRYEKGAKDFAGDQPHFTKREFPEFTEQPMHMLLMTKKTSGLSFGEIDTLLKLAGEIDSNKTAALAVRYHSILAAPLACLVCVALAIPFAVSGVRTNPMVGVSKAIGVFVIYFMLDRLGYALGEQQVIPPILAAWIPNVFTLVYAIRLCRRVD